MTTALHRAKASSTSVSQAVFKTLERLYADPGSGLDYGKALVKGFLYVTYCRLFKRRVRIALPFLIFCKKVTISGPGSVQIGRGCSVFANAFDRLTIVTLSPEARVRIGRKCDLGGVTIRCLNGVAIGDNGLFANCLLQDTPFLAQDAAQRSSGASVASKEIRIEQRVWVAGQAVVLCGATIGEGSVLSVGSALLHHAIPRNHLAFGSPVVRSASIDSVASFLRRQ